ncbi:MAG TPA: glycosyltransferase family 39 protein [Candidatus Desulfaltia sp.]|nr:glycosyltransferase family 39 protein [Candidatus Desulfaltia sp.]
MTFLNRYGSAIRSSVTIPHAAAAFFLLLTLATVGQYGFFGDELYYIACSKHLAFGYVDHPPLVAFLTLVSTWIFGETMIGLRILSGLAGAVTVLLSARIARILGGGTTSQALAALSICFAPAFPALSSFFSMNPVDIMLCTLFLYVFAHTIVAPSPMKWIGLGVLFGAGLLNKYTFLVLGFSVLMGLIITRRWEELRSGWLYLGGAIALIMFLPHIVWQIEHGWPALEFMHNVTQGKNLSLSPLTLLGQLAIGLNPLTLPLWIGGTLYLLLAGEMKAFRFLGWTAVMFIAVYIVQNSKFYYLLPVFPLLLAAGAVALESFSLRRRIRWPAWVVGSAMTISGLLLMPLAVPILPVEQFVSYAKTLGLREMVRMEKGEGVALPLHFAHRFGWEEKVDAVATAYHALPEHEREQCAILASWYGLAGAIDHFGPAHGLPPAICVHNSYWMWGTRGYTGAVVLAVGYDAHELGHYFDSVERVGYVEVPYDDDAAIFLCTKPKITIEAMWVQLKRFI